MHNVTGQLSKPQKNRAINSKNKLKNPDPKSRKIKF